MSKRDLEIEKPLLGAAQPSEGGPAPDLESFADPAKKNRKFIGIPQSKPAQSERPKQTISADDLMNESQKLVIEDLKDGPKSNKIQAYLMVMIDSVGALGFLTYCGFMQTYLSTFYLLMMLLIFNFMWQKIPIGIGKYTDSSQTTQVVIPISEFVRGQNGKDSSKIVFDDLEDPSHESAKSKNEYKPKYWIVFKDVQKYFWIAILVVSTLSLIAKIVFYVLLSTQPDLIYNESQQIMALYNFEGLEIYFTPKISATGAITIDISDTDYTKSFVPNLAILLASIFALILTREDKKINLETQNFEINSKVFKFYIVMVWLQLLGLISTASSVQGLVFLGFQLMLTVKIFIKDKSPNTLEVITVTLLKFYLYLMIIGLFAFGTQAGIIYQAEIQYLASFLGLDVLQNMIEGSWEQIVFVASSLILFVFLCLLTEQMQNEKRRVMLHPTIVQCYQHYEQFLKRQQEDQAYQEMKQNITGDEQPTLQAQSDVIEVNNGVELLSQRAYSEPDLNRRSFFVPSKSVQQQYLERFNTSVQDLVEKIRHTFDHPLVTLRFVQVTTIIIIILQKTYFTLILSFWVFCTGFTLNMNINYQTSMLFAIPTIFFNLIIQIYANIPHLGVPGQNNEFTICPEERIQNLTVPTTICGKLGFYTDDYSQFNILMMDITLCAFFLLLKQIMELQEIRISRKKVKSGGLHFMNKKSKDKTADVPISTILTAFIFKISYFISLFILFWVGFHEVNLIQFILVLFLLVFLINDSQLSIYQFTRPSKQLNQPAEVKNTLVPFAFKYWWTLVIYVELMIFIRYIYLFFYFDPLINDATQNITQTDYALQVIGINGNEYYEVIFWILFYFVALQYDSYRSKVYLKYSNNLLQSVMQNSYMKKLLPNYRQNEGIWYLVYLKSIIWVSFTVNLMILIFTAFNFINSFLLLIVGLIFCYFVGSFIEGVNYQRLKQLWYIYLYILVLAFMVRYAFQFICIPSPNAQLFSFIYDTLQYQFKEYGFYQYDFNQPSLRTEYLPDMITIFLGALSLNTFEIFSKSQKQMELNQLRDSYKSKSGLSLERRGSNNSQISVAEESSIDGGETITNNLLEQKLKQDTDQLAKMMDISLLDKWKGIKTPILIFANINTDIITIYVVVTAVFVTQSIAIGLIMLFYLRFYLLVHNRILDLLSDNGILKKLNKKVEYLKQKYSDLEVKARQSLRETDQQDIKRIVRKIKLTRLTTRIQVKQEVGRQSFYFTALCAFLTYMSLGLTSPSLSYMDDVQPPDWWIYLNSSFFVFGTYAGQTGTTGCFCGSTDSRPQCANETQVSSNIFENIWFFLLLIFVNVIDFMSTQVLIEDLETETALYENDDKPTFGRDSDLIGPKNGTQATEIPKGDIPMEKSIKKSKQDKQAGLSSIKEEEEEEKQMGPLIRKSQQLQQLDIQKTQNKAVFLHDFTIATNYIKTGDLEEKQALQIQYEKSETSQLDKSNNEGVEQLELIYQAQKYALMIQYYKNKDTLLGLTFLQAQFKILQRFFILIFLLNTLLANNLFSFYYLGVAAYLFLQKPNVSQMKILNICSIFAIFAQYILLLLNLTEETGKLPAYFQRTHPNFSVIQIYKMQNGEPLSEAWLTYLGFSDQTNHLQWVFILNTLVLSLIYSYFLLLDVTANQVLQKTIVLEQGMSQTEQVILLQLKTNPQGKISINYPSWKKRVYTVKNTFFELVVRNCHLFLMGLILLMAQIDHNVFNQVELVMALIFFIWVELFFKWPYTQNLDNFIIKYFQILYFIPVLTIFCNTALKIPYIISWCGPSFDQDNIGTNLNKYFVCQQIHGIEITGMAFIMFFISLYFDLVSSDEHQESVKKYIRVTLFKARMISKCLAYDANQKKYKEILFEQYQKNIFKEIQFQIMEKLKIWHRRMKDPTSKIQEQESEKMEQSEINETVFNKSQVKPSPTDVQKLIDEDISSTAVEPTAIQSILKSAIYWLQSNNDQFKFMGISNLMDYILAQNQALQRHTIISVEDYIKEDYRIFKSELDLIDAFYTQLYKKMALQQDINSELIAQVVSELLPENRRQSTEAKQYLQQSSAYEDDDINYDRDQMLKFSDYKKSRELAYVHIIDPKINFFNTKILAQDQDFGQFTSSGLFVLFMKEMGRYLISNWSVFCYIMFILYFCKNSGILGGVLPMLLFLWIIIEEGEAPQVFWKFSFVFISFIMISIFTLTQVGLYRPQDQTQKPWWYPLYDAQGSGMVYETLLIWIILIQLFLQKKWGVYNQTIAQVENIFKGYIRMKINKYGADASEEIIKDEPILQLQEKREEVVRSSSDYPIVPMEKPTLKRSYSQGGIVDLKSSRASIVQNQSDIIDDQVNQLYDRDSKALKSKKIKNKFEQRIDNEPELLNTNDKFSFFERTFATKFAKPGKDLYPLIAGIQIIIFLYLLFFFTGMVSGRNNFNSIIKQNQFPGSLVIVLLFQMILMVFERFVTLRTPFVSIDQQQQNILEDEKTQKAALRASQKKVEDESSQGQLDLKEPISITTNIQKGLDQKPKKKEDLLEYYRVQFMMKYLLQLFLIVIVYIFIFVYLGKAYQKIVDQNSTVQDNFETTTSIVFFFLLESIYFYLSALQLKYGYRELKMRNTFLQKNSQPYYIYGKGFYAIPFLFELKVLMDWTFIQTSLDVFQWFKLEDIHGLMYFSKINANNYKARNVGQKVPPVMKFGIGCTLVTFILICIFGPLILFSTLNPSTEKNLVDGGQFTINLVNSATKLNVPLFTSNQLQFQQPLTNADQIFAAFRDANGTNITDTNLNNVTILDANKFGAIQKFQLLPFSNSDWDISQPLFKLLTFQLNETITRNTTNTFSLEVTYGLSRQKAETTSTKNSFSYPEELIKNLGFNQSLSIEDLNATYKSMMFCDQNILPLQNFYIQTLQIFSTDGKTFKPRPVYGGVPAVENVSMSLNCVATNVSANSTQSWWEFTYQGDTESINPEGQQGLLFFVVTDNFSSLTSGFSIITIYTTVILVIATFIRSLFSGQVFLMEFTDMLTPDDLLMICEAISIARNQKDFVKENLLYFELIDILRSPEIVKVMTGSWSETFKKKYLNQRAIEEKKKLKYD